MIISVNLKIFTQKAVDKRDFKTIFIKCKWYSVVKLLSFGVIVIFLYSFVLLTFSLYFLRSAYNWLTFKFALLELKAYWQTFLAVAVLDLILLEQNNKINWVVLFRVTHLKLTAFTEQMNKAEKQMKKSKVINYWKKNAIKLLLEISVK